jgi:hypothetical protein
MNSLLLFNIVSLMPFIPLLVVAYIFLVPPFFKLGKIEYAYLYRNSGKLYLILIHNFSSVYMGKGSSSEKHRYRVKKIDLSNFELIYDMPFAKFGAKFMAGYLNVLGVSGSYLFLNYSRSGLTILDLNNGRIKANKRQLLAENPEVIDLVDEDMKFEEESGRMTVYNIEGKLFEVLPESLELRPINPERSKAGSNIAINLFNLPKFSNDRHSRGVNIFNELRIGEKRKYVASLKQEKDSKRYKILVEADRFVIHEVDISEFLPTEKSVSFIKPQILGRYHDCFYLKEPYRFIIQHQAFLEKDDDRDSTYVSLVNGRSEEIWRLHYPNIVHKKLLQAKEHELIPYVDEAANQIWFFFMDEREAKMSVSYADLENGLVLKEPLLILNKWSEKKKLG